MREKLELIEKERRRLIEENEQYKNKLETAFRGKSQENVTPKKEV
jgi:hypothetical protein